jgi:excinuclease UvrABC ATPase subunit
MTSVKIWCEACHGTGTERLKQFYDCEKCDGKGFKTCTIEQLASPVTIHDGIFSCAPSDAYTISDAEVDAKVLESVGPYVREVPHDQKPPIANAIASVIMHRLHAFYCGGTK